MAVSGRVELATCRHGAAVVYVVGARPNFMKTIPVLREMRDRDPHRRHVLVHTGQHFDPEMSDVFLEELGVADPDYNLGVGSGTHGAQTGRALEMAEAVLLEVQPSLVIVPGDVNSALAAALAAAKLGIPVAHIEAGLRSFDRTMPEELNRVLVDQLSDICFVHSPEAVANLEHEGIAIERIENVGNTMIDSLVRVLPLSELSGIHKRLELAPGRYLLVTLHRPALVDGPLFPEVLAELAHLSAYLPVVFPAHPRVAAVATAYLASAPDVHVVPPLGIVDFVALEKGAAAVLTDSGGVQEETTFLGVPCYTLRDNTERPVTVTQGTNTLLGLSPRRIAEIPDLLQEHRARPPSPEGWDGAAAGRIATALQARGWHPVARTVHGATPAGGQ